MALLVRARLSSAFHPALQICTHMRSVRSCPSFARAILALAPAPAVCRTKLTPPRLNVLRVGRAQGSVIVPLKWAGSSNLLSELEKRRCDTRVKTSDSDAVHGPGAVRQDVSGGRGSSAEHDGGSHLSIRSRMSSAELRSRAPKPLPNCTRSMGSVSEGEGAPGQRILDSRRPRRSSRGC